MGRDKPFSELIPSIHIVTLGWVLWWFHYIFNIFKRRADYAASQ